MCYFSSALSSAQRNYSAGQVEAWALVAAIRKWRIYLRAAEEVILLTDRNPLRWLRSQSDPRHTFERWIIELEEIPYEIHYRPGSQNAVPDYLRRSETMKLDGQVNIKKYFERKVYRVDDHEQWIDAIKRGQKNDSGIRDTVVQLLESRSGVQGPLKNVASRLRIVREVPYYGDRLVVPKICHQEVLERVHSGAHFGQPRTLRLLRRSYFWIGMARGARVHCRACLVCQRAKPSRVLKQPMELFGTMDARHGVAVAMDIGTLPWGDRDHRYFLLIVDLFSHYIETVQLKDQKADTIVRAFLEGWIFRGHGIPRVLVSDQEKNVDGECVRNTGLKSDTRLRIIPRPME